MNDPDPPPPEPPNRSVTVQFILAADYLTRPTNCVKYELESVV